MAHNFPGYTLMLKKSGHFCFFTYNIVLTTHLSVNLGL